ncbi:O-antigen ligase family protein [Nocardioides bigeumensis]|uniref:O-antigen ligase-related domain-containing protein n=1 Tax=Nocardioides bigeumensis TaxID=433657 RepID=A0ABP5K553_9ACTN
MRSQNIAWDLEPEETPDERAERETRISDFALAGLLPLSAVPIPALGLPFNEVAALALVALGCLRQPAKGRSVPLWLVVMMGSLLALLVLSARLNGIDGSRRLIHMVGYVGLAWVIASGRVSRRSVARGLTISLALTVAYGGATLPTSSYAGRLTGVLADPNVAAFLLVTLGLVSIPHVQHRVVRRLAMLTVLAGVLLTFSRTGLLALILVCLWLLLGRRIRLVGGVLVMGALVWLVTTIPDDLRLFGPFSDRSGSDALRARIIAAEYESLANMPWYGHGPGTAGVFVQDEIFFFHNSYLATRQEGGWLALVLVVGMLVAAFVGLDAKVRSGVPEALWMQGGVIAVLVMASTLGEVLLDLPTAVVIGFAVATASRVEPPEPAVPPPTTTAQVPA